MKKIYFVLALFYIGTLISCEEKKATTDTDTTKKDSTKTSFKVITGEPSVVIASLRDSANMAWEVMIKSDDQKIDDLGRLLQEISYCKKYNVLLHDSLTTVVKTMKEKRYQQLTMTSAEIDQYDEFTDRIIRRVKYLGNTTKDLASHPLAESLYADIAEADNNVARYRNLYDGFAFTYNDYLEANKAALGDKAKDFQKLPVFRLMPV